MLRKQQELASCGYEDTSAQGVPETEQKVLKRMRGYKASRAGVVWGVTNAVAWQKSTERLPEDVMIWG
jgi:hypothetical protein